MTITKLKLGKRKFVILPERDFNQMQRENQAYQRLAEEDRALGALAQKELKIFRLKNFRKNVGKA
ncbi:MAG: hypothetical protein WCI73_05375 [Phycisphaerae bacterium]